MKSSKLNVYVLLTNEIARPKQKRACETKTKTAPLSIKMRKIDSMKLVNEGVCAIYHPCTKGWWRSLP